MKEKIISMWKNTWNFIKELLKHPLDALLPTLLAEIVFWSPLWISALLAITISSWWWSIVTGILVFWAGPFTPAIVLQVGLIGVFVGVWNKIKRRTKKWKTKK